MQVECNYTIGTGKTQETFNLMALTRRYYETTHQLTNKKIFSSDDIMKSTLKPIQDQLDRVDDIIDAKGKARVYDYIVEIKEPIEYVDLGQTLEGRFAPEYNEANLILNIIRNRLHDQDGENVPENFTLKQILATYPSKAQAYLDDITETLTIQKKTTEFSVGIHKILSRLIKEDGNFDNSLERALAQEIEAHKEVFKGDTQLWVSQFKDALTQIYAEVTSDGKRVLTEVNLMSEDSAIAQLRGKLDIIAVDKEGRVHIYDLKLSKDPYEEWDSAKRLVDDWQLAFYRALLGQYVQVSDATVNILPIKLGGLDADKQLTASNVRFEGVKNRLTETAPRDGRGLLPTGRLYKIAAYLIPGVSKFAYDPEKTKAMFDDLQLLFPDYQIKTSNINNDIDKLIESAIKAGGLKSQFSEFKPTNARVKDNWVTVNPMRADGVTYKSNAELKTEWRAILTEYVAFSTSDQNLSVMQLKQKIIASIDSNGASIDGYSDRERQVINYTLKGYLDGGYRVMRGSDAVTDLGIIILQNKQSNSYVFINVTGHNQKGVYRPGLSYEDVDGIKALVFADHFLEELGLDRSAIQGIININSRLEQSPYVALASTYDKYRQLMDSTGLVPKLNKHHLMPIERIVGIEVETSQKDLAASYTADDPAGKKIGGIIARYTETQPIAKLELHKLKLLVAAITHEYPFLKEKTLQTGFNFESKLEFFFAKLQILLLIKADQLPIGDFAGLKDFNIQTSSIKNMFDGVFLSQKEVYDADSRKIGSVIDGLKTITPDRVGSIDLKNVNNIITSTNSFIRRSMYTQSTEIATLTRAYQQSTGFSPSEGNWLGNFTKISRVFWVTDSSGKISSEWKVKNPYADDLDNVLKPNEQAYLKGILFHINKRRIGLSDKAAETVDFTSLDTLKKTMSTSVYAKLIQAMEDSDYFKMPLIRSQRIDRNKGIITESWGEKFAAIDRAGKELNNFLDDRQITTEEQKMTQRDLGMYEMYDIYAQQSDEFKIEQLNLNPPDYYELDLDTIAHRVTFSQIRKKHVDTILPVINAYIWWMKLQAGRSNTDISKELEYLKNRLKQGLFDESIINPDFEDIIKATSTIKSITTAGMLAFRPVLFVKEMVLGMYKGIALASLKIYGGDQFTLKDWTAAVKKLMTIDNQFSTEWNLIDGLNLEYGFANMDVNTISRKMQTNRRGVLLGLSPWMYSMNTIPDYYNRLALFLAKLIHEGSYDAHSMVNGRLVYDPRKDQRFSHYFQVRDRHKNPNADSPIKYLPSKDDLIYNTQRAKYNLLVQELNVNRQAQEYELYQEGDIVDLGYSELERSSYKTFTDTVYGYYDADSQAEWHKTWYGILYLQFLQFWPGKMEMWFGTKREGKASPSGYHRQKQTQDKDKKPVLMWRKPIFTEDGDILDFEETTENTGDPAWEWVGTPQEGLFQSMLKTAKDVVKGDWTNIKNEELRTNRALYGAADAILMMIIFGIIAAMLKAIIAENGTDGISGTTLSFMEAANTKVLSESNLWGNTFGALRSKPAFWTYSTKVAGDILSLAQGNKDIQQVVSRNARAFEFWQPDTN